MNILYGGQYQARFKPIIDILSKLPTSTRVLELCFGDTYIAEYCRSVGKPWRGLDINASFVHRAKVRGFDAEQCDLLMRSQLPDSDLCIIAGSLYHFSESIVTFLRTLLKSTPVVIISEPVVNLSSRRGLIGYIARKSANAGRGNEESRYSYSSLIKMLEFNSEEVGYTIRSIKQINRDAVILLERK